jgi:hypothetical protein
MLPVAFVRSIIAILATRPRRDERASTAPKIDFEWKLLSIPIDDFHTSWVRHSRSWAKPRRNAFAGMLVIFCVVHIFDEKEKVEDFRCSHSAEFPVLHGGLVCE